MGTKKEKKTENEGTRQFVKYKAWLQQKPQKEKEEDGWEKEKRCVVLLPVTRTWRNI